ncbi:hypothetical protein Pcinc_015923 [Petrolisthes cinctipes]|uniref:Uncharacterized protein n=1 Tax=Petrolisthes cinctipes TaxID=88211 RepID=A0AAE1FXA7_PETCI|nr:hypothetical protein Pcinc_015923 [Petrolisthes cinctipes]
MGQHLMDAQKFHAVVRALPVEIFYIVQSRLEESVPTTYMELKDIISRALGKTKAVYMEQLDLMQADGRPLSTILRHMKQLNAAARTLFPLDFIHLCLSRPHTMRGSFHTNSSGQQRPMRYG